MKDKIKKIKELLNEADKSITRRTYMNNEVVNEAYREADRISGITDSIDTVAAQKRATADELKYRLGRLEDRMTDCLELIAECLDILEDEKLVK